MSDHFIITADHGHVRIFRHDLPPGQATSELKEVQSLDFPNGLRSYTDRDTDMAGRFQGSKQQMASPGAPTSRTGMSIDERMPMKEEEERRQIRDVAETIGSFLQARPQATWDFAAPPSVHNAVLESIPADVRARLNKSLAKDLVHQGVDELRRQFATVQPHHA